VLRAEFLSHQRSFLAVFCHSGLNRCNALRETRESSLTRLTFIMKIKLCVLRVGVHLAAIALSYSDDVGSVQNKKHRSKEASLWYATENRCYC